MKTGDLDIIDFFHVHFTHLQCSRMRYVGRNATALSSAWSNILRAVTLCCHQLQCHIFNEASLNHLFAYNSRSVFNFFLPCLLTLVPVCRPMSLEMTTMTMKAVGILSVSLQPNHSLCETLHLERGRGRKGEGWKGASPPRGKGEVVQFPRITHFHH